MTGKRTDDAVDHFSGHVKQFHAYYEDRPEFQERLDIWRELLDKHIVPGGLSIDMGCGTGILSFELATKRGRVVGVDGAPDMVKCCEAQRIERGLDNIRFMEALLPDVDETGLAGADLVISSSVVEYVDDLDGTLALFSRLLKPGAVLILSMPNVWCLNRIYERVKYNLTGEPQIYRHIRHFSSPRRLQMRVRHHGLALEEVRYYTHFTRLAKLTRMLRLPIPLTEDLFVAVLRRS
jgi:2-polyprenyl-3-methyl-5-hydroxy-6-metoxy-1,4-benzoquinol methylase